MGKNNNLTYFLTDLANAIRTKKGTAGLINPQDFSREIANISGGSGISGVSEDMQDYKINVDFANINSEIVHARIYNKANGSNIQLDLDNGIMDLKTDRWFGEIKLASTDQAAFFIGREEYVLTANKPSTINLTTDNVTVPYPPEEVWNLKWFITKESDTQYKMFVSTYGFGYTSKYYCIKQDGSGLDNEYAYSYMTYIWNTGDSAWTYKGCGTSSTSGTSYNPRASNHDIYNWTDINTKGTIKKAEKTN